MSSFLRSKVVRIWGLAAKRSLKWVYVNFFPSHSKTTPQESSSHSCPKLIPLLLFEQLHGILYLEILSLEAVKQVIIECLKQGRIWDCADSSV